MVIIRQSSKINARGIQGLTLNGLITVTDQIGNELVNTSDRKGNPRLYYSFQPSYFILPTMVQSSLRQVYKKYYRQN